MQAPWVGGRGTQSATRASRLPWGSTSDPGRTTASLVVALEQRELILRAVYDVADGQALQPVTVVEVAQYIAVPQGLVWESLTGFSGLVVADPPAGVYLTAEGVEAAGRIRADVVARR